MDFIDKKYLMISSTYLVGWKDLGDDKYNFRCPLCGDSKKNKAKRRAYFFPHNNDVFFKCHNCGSSMALKAFLTTISPDLASQYRLDKFQQKHSKTENVKEDKIEKFITNTKERLEKSKTVLSSTQRIFTLDEDHPARVFLDKRMIPKEKQRKLFYVDNAAAFVNSIENYQNTYTSEKGAIVIPFYDEVGVLTYCQLRMLEGKFRYLTLELAPGKKIYGLEDIDWNKNVYVVEGPFDSMFIDNCLAVAGVSILSERKYLQDKCKNGYTLIFDRDYQYNKEVFKQLKEAIDLNEKVVMFDKEFEGKDINETVVMNKWDKSEVMNYIDKHTKKGLTAKLALSLFKNPC